MTLPTKHIGAKAAQTRYYAREQAARLGLPLNYVVTINFASTAVDPRAAVPSFSRLRRHHFNKWATRPSKKGGPAFKPTYAFVFENARDGSPFLTMAAGDPHNVHVHWEVHIPPCRFHDFEMEVWSWVERTTGGITGTSEAIHISPLIHQKAGYPIKGALPHVVKLYGRGQKAEPQGIIIGRRADTSRNIGPKARRRMDRELGIARRLPSKRLSDSASQPAP